jgi:hypothetical protein
LSDLLQTALRRQERSASFSRTLYVQKNLEVAIHAITNKSI